MGTIDSDDSDDKYSVIGEAPKIGFLDFHQEQLVQDENLMNEGPVMISCPFPLIDGKPQSAPVGTTKFDCVTLTNTTTEPIELWGVKIYSSTPEGSYTLSLMKPPSDASDVEALCGFLECTSLEDQVLQPKKKLTIWLSCKLQELGLHSSIVHFSVGDDKIERVVFLLADDKVSNSLVPKRPYRRANKRNAPFYDQNKKGYVPGPSAPRASPQRKHYLPPFDIPVEFREFVQGKGVPEVVLGGLNVDNYVEYFRSLLFMEEIHLEDEMRQHDMDRVTMSRRGKYLALEVPGLAERRPSLVTGDYIFVSDSGQDKENTIPYQGCIHRVEADAIFLKFAAEFHQGHQENKLYDVRFRFNRINHRRCHQAIETAKAELAPKFLFPSQGRVINVSPAVPLNQNLNVEQISCVERILACRGAPPYVIHGPPGTGKTVTLVEAILQLYKTRKGRRGARILVCAASNSAADHVLDRVINNDTVSVEKREIFRLNAPARPYEDVPPEVLEFCCCDDRVFKCPPIDALLGFRIIVCTYMSASLLHGERVKRGHFSHLFLDEAGQASEPETMISLANFCQRDTVVVLAGDPMQLGPVIYSKQADNLGLGKSYLERLFECEPYLFEDENLLTKLVRNYRCHQAILKLPSELFYEGKLLPCKEHTDSLSQWDDLPCEEFPVLYVGIQGCDEREGINPSWFNRFEASKVLEIIKRLRDRTDVSEADIGVITPYRQQVAKIKNALEVSGMKGVKVGSVEQFQGQERRVIIISTVRSTVKHNEFDSRHNLGFLRNPKRFNVAITRAKSLLIIVGNPYIITKDPYWDALLRYCSENNSYQGCPLPPPEKHRFPNSGFQSRNDQCELNKQLSGGDWPENSGEAEEGLGGWDDDSGRAEEAPKSVVYTGSWDDDSVKAEEAPKPVIYTGGWDDDSGRVEETAEAVIYTDTWDDDSGKAEESCSNVADNECHNEGCLAEYSGGFEAIPPPCFDESQWSDGWTGT